jgi:integrase
MAGRRSWVLESVDCPLVGGAAVRVARFGHLARLAVLIAASVRAPAGRLPHRHGILFPAPEGGRIDINNWRNRSWTPSLAAAGIRHRRIYDLRHTYASWSLAAGVDIFTLARRMGTSVKMIDQTYGHLITGADVHERDLLDAFDETHGEPFGHVVDTEDATDAS